MMHRTQCMDCGKIERIEVQKGQPIKSGWAYYGKVDINFCKTNRYFYKPKDQAKSFSDCERVPNPCYDPTVKPKRAELWSCPQCMANLKKEGK